MVSDDGALREVVENVIRDNPQSVEDYHARQEEGDRFPGWTDDESHAWPRRIQRKSTSFWQSSYKFIWCRGFFRATSL